jgi:hypothetical protein
MNKENLTLLGVWDSPPIGFAFNVYLDEETGTVYKEDVWNNKGVLFVTVQNEVVKL